MDVNIKDKTNVALGQRWEITKAIKKSNFRNENERLQTNKKHLLE